jgi:hypothetical protein
MRFSFHSRVPSHSSVSPMPSSGRAFGVPARVRRKHDTWSNELASVWGSENLKHETMIDPSLFYCSVREISTDDPFAIGLLYLYVGPRLGQ